MQRLHKALTDTLNDPVVRAGLDAHSLLMAEPLPLEAVGRSYAEGTEPIRIRASSRPPRRPPPRCARWVATAE